MPLVVSQLDELADRINAAHKECRYFWRVSQEQAHRSLTHAREAGKWLNQAKAQVPWGNWGKWIEANCSELTDRTAQAYMQIDREWDELQSLPSFNQLNYSTALALLGKLNQPEPLVIEVIEGELVEDTPTPKPCQFEVGQVAVVSSSKNLHAGEQIEIVGKRGQVLIGATSKGEYPFLPGELQPALGGAPTPLIAAQPQASSKELLAAAKSLLQRTLDHLPSGLAAEIQNFLT